MPILRFRLSCKMDAMRDGGIPGLFEMMEGGRKMPGKAWKIPCKSLFNKGNIAVQENAPHPCAQCFRFLQWV